MCVRQFRARQRIHRNPVNRRTHAQLSLLSWRGFFTVVELNTSIRFDGEFRQRFQWRDETSVWRCGSNMWRKCACIMRARGKSIYASRIKQKPDELKRSTSVAQSVGFYTVSLWRGARWGTPWIPYRNQRECKFYAVTGISTRRSALTAFGVISSIGDRGLRVCASCWRCLVYYLRACFDF